MYGEKSILQNLMSSTPLRLKAGTRLPLYHADLGGVGGKTQTLKIDHAVTPFAYILPQKPEFVKSFFRRPITSTNINQKFNYRFLSLRFQSA